ERAVLQICSASLFGRLSGHGFTDGEREAKLTR
ncbi:MAG: hypothetical protein EORIYHIE_000101, partial [Candidatus Fervidibacter sp.]